VFVLLLVVAGSFGGLGGVLTARTAPRREQMHRILAESGALQVAGNGHAADPGAFASWARAMARDPAVLLTAWVAADGTLLDQRPTGTPALAQLASDAATGKHNGTSDINVGTQRVRVHTAVGRLPSGAGAEAPAAVVIVARSDATSVGAIKLVCTAALAVVAGFFGQLWVRRFLTRPLAILTDEGDAPRDALRQMAEGRRDELGLVAGKIVALANDLAAARVEVARLERTLDQRVADQTRDIHAALRRTERQAWLDPLTGLGNRRMLDERLEEVFEGQRAAGGDLSVAMFDVDHFKDYNDARGHTAGDEILRFIGELLRGSLRASDIGIRYGGDEFAVLLPDVELPSATALAERIVRLFDQRTALLSTNPRLTMSAGVASLRGDEPASGKRLIELADSALYAAKHGGKNRAVTTSAGRIAAPLVAATT